MKKIITFLLALSFCIIFSACGGRKQAEDGGSEPTPTISAQIETAVGAEIKTKYKAGTYKVGTEISAGEYYLEPMSNTLVSYSVYSDGAKESLLDIEIFEGQCFVTVDDGQYLEIDNCTAMPVEKITTNFDDSNLNAGMYRVGIDIPRGEYKLYPPDNRSAYIHVYTNSTESRETIQSETIDDIKYITVDDGQYFFLFNCTAEIVKQ